MHNRVLIVECIEETTFVGRWREPGRRDQRVEYALDLVDPDDRDHLQFGTELRWSFARPNDERLAVVHHEAA